MENTQDILDNIDKHFYTIGKLDNLTQRLDRLSGNESDLRELMVIKQEILNFSNRYKTNFRIGYEEAHDINFNIRTAHESIGSVLEAAWKFIAGLFSKLFGGGGGGSSASEKADKKIDKINKEIDKMMEKINKSSNTHVLSASQSESIRSKAPNLINKGVVSKDSLAAMTKASKAVISGLELYIDGEVPKNIKFGTSVTKDMEKDIKSGKLTATSRTDNDRAKEEYLVLKSMKDTVTIGVGFDDKNLYTSVNVYQTKVDSIKGKLKVENDVLKELISTIGKSDLFNSSSVSDIVSSCRTVVEERKDGKKRDRMKTVLKTISKVDKRIARERVMFAELVADVVEYVYEEVTKNENNN